LPAKLRPPQARVRLVERHALLKSLGGATAPLVVLCAPPGAGKTTVLRQWAEEDARPLAWVQLDEADCDPVVLLTYLTLALESITDVDPSVKASLSLAVPPLRERILPLVGEALAAAPGFLLVLDDAHVLSGDGPWDVVGFVLRNLPQGAQVALGSRVDPGLPLARMRAAGDVAEVRGAELSLSRDEVAELMRLHNCEADEATADAVLTVTEGWATGLQLACMASGGRPPGREGRVIAR
jgi:LuxR family maltose regulon positive regulatory protein